MAINYSDISKATNTGTKPGYKPELYFISVADLATEQFPTGSSAGDSVTIAVAHILATGKATHQWDAKLFSVTMTSKPVGDPGALTFNHEATVVVNGDNAIEFEQIVKMMNDFLIIFIKDADCVNNLGYKQLGDSCNPVLISPEFDGKTNDPTKGGQKEWTFKITSAAQYFYTAALPAPAA